MKGDVVKKGYTNELETISFNVSKISEFNCNKDDSVQQKSRKCTSKSNKISFEVNRAWTNEPKTQLQSFQQAMSMLITFGHSLGLNPVQGSLGTSVANMRLKILSWRFLYCIVIAISQTATVILCFYMLFTDSISIESLSNLTFNLSTCVATFLYIQIGYRWTNLMNDISKSKLNEYVDQETKKKCYILTAMSLSLGLIEHILSLLHKLEHVVSCYPDSNIYYEYLKDQFPWYFDYMPPNIIVGIVLQILLLITTMNWNYLDLYIVCVSVFLAGILNKINAKIIAASEKKTDRCRRVVKSSIPHLASVMDYDLTLLVMRRWPVSSSGTSTNRAEPITVPSDYYLPTYYLRHLREDYTRATRLVRSFDDVISGLVFTSFASNLFFICLQVYNILLHGFDYKNSKIVCPAQSHGFLGGHEYQIYLLFSCALLFTRAMTVSLVAASINTSSLIPASALYNIPSSVFCDEVSRFITQVNEDKVALSGLKFFYVTRNLVLSVAGTIVTYELVLLQFSSG